MIVYVIDDVSTVDRGLVVFSFFCNFGEHGNRGSTVQTLRRFGKDN